MMAIDLRVAALLAVTLAGLAAGDGIKRWLDAPMPLSVAADFPTPAEIPGIPMLRPASPTSHQRHPA